MSFLGLLAIMGAIYFGPILIALFAAALIVPRGWLEWYAALAITPVIAFCDYSGAHEDGPFAGLGSFVFNDLAILAVIAGLVARWLMGDVRRPEPKSRRPD